MVHVSTSGFGGAGRAAVRLHNALLKGGVDSYFLSLEKDLPKDLVNGSSITIPEKTFLQWQALRIKYRAKKHLGLNLYNYKETISNELNRISNNLQCESFTLPFSNCRLWEHPMFQSADIIHLHWISGMLDYPEFFRKNLKPVVWTLHDMNAFRGLFHYKEDEVRNKNIVEKLDKKILSIKVKAVQKKRSKLTVVTPSRWLLKDALESEVFKDVPGFCIPYAIDTDVFSPQADANFKKKNNIPEKNIVFLFVAHSVNVIRKGFGLLLGALKSIENLPITLIVLGEANYWGSDKTNDIRSFGSIKEDSALAYYYSNSDAFIIPSLEDNLPNTMVESLVCGTPVIGFPIGGIKENIINYENGILAEEVNSESLAIAIEDFCRNRGKFNSVQISKNARTKFDEKLISHQYIEVYNRILNLNQNMEGYA